MRARTAAIAGALAVGALTACSTSTADTAPPTTIPAATQRAEDVTVAGDHVAWTTAGKVDKKGQGGAVLRWPAASRG